MSDKSASFKGDKFRPKTPAEWATFEYNINKDLKAMVVAGVRSKAKSRVDDNLNDDILGAARLKEMNMETARKTDLTDPICAVLQARAERDEKELRASWDEQLGKFGRSVGGDIDPHGELDKATLCVGVLGWVGGGPTGRSRLIALQLNLVESNRSIKQWATFCFLGDSDCAHPTP